MRHIEGLKKTAQIVGLTPWELRTGALTGKYPAMRVGGSRGRIVFDIDLLNARIGQLMESNVRPAKNECNCISSMVPIAK